MRLINEAATVLLHHGARPGALTSAEHGKCASGSDAGLRVAVYGRCIPFLLDDLPHELSVGRMRRDTIATTVTRLGHNGYDEQRRVVAHAHGQRRSGGSGTAPRGA